MAPRGSRSSTGYLHGFVIALLVAMLACPNNGLMDDHPGVGFAGGCPTDPRNCTCRWSMGSEAYIECSKKNQEVQLRIMPQEYAEVRCLRRRAYDIDHVPQFEIGDTKELIIDGCAFLQHQTILQTVSFLGITNVRRLTVLNNAFNASFSLEKDHFIGLEYIERLVLNNVKLTNVQKDVFELLVNLSWLDMRDNMLLTLPIGIFDPLPSLLVLRLDVNRFKTLEPRLLLNLKNLRELSIWHNNLRNISRESFANVPYLEVLDLSGNSFRKVPHDLFYGLPRLTEVNLGNNRFRQLPKRLFQNNRVLHTVKMAFHRVKVHTLPEDFLQNLTWLEDVNLERLMPAQLPEKMLHGSTNILKLNLASNRLETVPKNLLRDQYALHELLLHNNKLTELPEGFLSNTHELRTLRLSFNHISVLSDRMIRSLSKLEQLYIDHNKLKEIESDAFKQTPAIQILHLHANHLTYDSLNGLSEFTKLGYDDTYGQVEQEGTPFRHLHRLFELNLGENLLAAIPRDLLVNTRELERLNLTHNKFTSLKYTDLQFVSPSITVDLRHNSIFEIDITNIEQMMRLDLLLKRHQESRPHVGQTRILLNDNPIHCNCIVHTLAQYVQHQLEPAVYERLELVTDELTCQSPKNLQGVLVRDVPLRAFLCELDSPLTTVRHCPHDCYCLIRPDDMGVIIDCRGLRLTEVPPLPRPSSFGYRFLELHLENNNISALPSKGKRTTGWAEVQQLYVSNNSIRAVEPDQLPKSLQLLDLSRNQLTEVEVSIMETLSNETKLRLAQNKWTCNCETAPFIAYALTNQHRIQDFGRLSCTDGSLMAQMKPGDLCNNSIVLLSVIMAIMVCLLVVVLIVCGVYCIDLRVWLFKYGLCMIVEDDEGDEEKPFDAFVSYSSEDEVFITEHLVPTLTRHPINYKLWLYMRNWTSGEMIYSQMACSLEQSRRTIIVLSSSFLESFWGRIDLRTAFLRSTANQRNRLIIINYGDIGNFDRLEPELRACLHTNTYLCWGDRWFWDKLLYAMPRLRSSKTRRDSRGNEVVPAAATGPMIRTAGLFLNPLRNQMNNSELIQQQSARPLVLATLPIDPVDVPNESPFSNFFNRAIVELPPLYQDNRHINEGFVNNVGSVASNELVDNVAAETIPFVNNAESVDNYAASDNNLEFVDNVSVDTNANNVSVDTNADNVSVDTNADILVDNSTFVNNPASIDNYEASDENYEESDENNEASDDNNEASEDNNEASEDNNEASEDNNEASEDNNETSDDNEFDDNTVLINNTCPTNA